MMRSETIVLFEEKLSLKERILNNLYVCILYLGVILLLTFVYSRYSAVLFIPILFLCTVSIFRRSKNYLSYLAIRHDKVFIKYQVFNAEIEVNDIPIHHFNLVLATDWYDKWSGYRMDICLNEKLLFSQRPIDKWCDEKFVEVVDFYNKLKEV